MTWGKGIITLIHKGGDANNLDNYRPITLLPTIYKIWATIITNRLAPVMNLLKKDNQCAYKAKRSTADAVYFLKRNLVKKINGHISFGPSKAFDGINRGKLRWALYGKGLPTNLIDMIINGHTDNSLYGKLNCEIGTETYSDKGVFEGSPTSASIYIIFADGIMEEYKDEIKKKNCK